MRWREPTLPQDDETRVVSVFLLWPRKIAGETRWLERAGIRQRYRLYSYTFFPAAGQGFWMDMAWVDGVIVGVSESDPVVKHVPSRGPSGTLPGYNEPHGGVYPVKPPATPPPPRPPRRL